MARWHGGECRLRLVGVTVTWLRQRWPLVAWGLSFLLIAVVLVQVQALSTRTNDALCTLRGNLEQRVVDTEAYLEEHPNGFPGVSAADLQRSVDGQRSTIAALSDLDCDE